jgi:DNA repair protein RecO (recombination protein O)
MLSSTKGIILHFVKYGETSLITTAYTEKFGRQAYLVNSAFGKNAKNKASLLQPMYLIEMEVYQKQSREVQRIKEFKPYAPFQSIPFDVGKSAQTIFIAEVLFKLLREEESNPGLFNFIENSMMTLDKMEDGANNFHLFFLVHLTKFLGIYPHISGLGNPEWLDMKKGVSTSAEPAHPLFMDMEQTSVFNQLGNMDFGGLPQFFISRKLRQSLLAKITEYYRQHYETIGEVKSLTVLNEVFK